MAKKSTLRFARDSFNNLKNEFYGAISETNCSISAINSMYSCVEDAANYFHNLVKKVESPYLKWEKNPMNILGYIRSLSAQREADLIRDNIDDLKISDISSRVEKFSTKLRDDIKICIYALSGKDIDETEQERAVNRVMSVNNILADYSIISKS